MIVDADARSKRMKYTAEVFTPDLLVTQMLMKLPKSVWAEGKTFCDPAVGNGQFLIYVLLQKIRRGHKPIEALRTIYGVDILPDNVNECRIRLLKLVSAFEDVTKEHIAIVLQNIACADSLEFDFEFEVSPSSKLVKKWMKIFAEIMDDIPLACFPAA